MGALLGAPRSLPVVAIRCVCAIIVTPLRVMGFGEINGKEYTRETTKTNFLRNVSKGGYFSDVLRLGGVIRVSSGPK